MWNYIQKAQKSAISKVLDHVPSTKHGANYGDSVMGELSRNDG